MKNLLILLLAVLSLPAFAQERKEYQVHINLNEVTDDRLKVELIVPETTKDTVEFQIPKIVPGTYSISDFGRFMNDFQAFTSEGDTLATELIDVNRIRIYQGKDLYKIAYRMDDTFDSKLENPIFEPGGTNIEANTNYVLNTFGFVGYLEGMEQQPFELHIQRPEKFYGATALPLVKTAENNTDIFRAENYFNLTDSPIMYCEPDTTTLEVGGAEVLVSVYSPNNMLNSKFVMQSVKDVLIAQKNYLGGTLPVDRYAFLIYLSPERMASGSWGALEHSYSSLYFLPEARPEFLTGAIRDVAAHEFFHILTPLNIHSEEIHYFDFINPEMSEHLWLYEGVTEYAAGHVQVKYDLIEKGKYYSIIAEKMQAAEKFNDTLPFTTMSANCLHTYEDQYLNVYQKGALIGMCLDLKLLDLSDGEYNLQALMRDLAKTYGKDQPFKDEELFNKIEELTYPEIRTFLENHVAGSEPLPYQESLQLAGVQYYDSLQEQSATLGNVGMGYNPETERVFVNNLSDANEFADDMKYEVGDEIISINGQELKPGTFIEVLEDFQANTEEGDRVKMVVARKNRRGKWKTKKLRGRAMVVSTSQEHVIMEMDEPNERQLMIRNAWLEKDEL